MANFNINKVILGGRLTADIELKATPNGVAVAQFSIAINRRGKDAQTDFINCVAWRQTAEFISKYFAKGSSICVVGELQKRTYTDKNGAKRDITEAIITEALFVDSKNDAQGVETASPTNYIPDAYKQPQTANFEGVSPDDDLPF
jgi:single-strand DNA-binding protein